MSDATNVPWPSLSRSVGSDVQLIVSTMRASRKWLGLRRTPVSKMATVASEPLLVAWIASASLPGATTPPYLRTSFARCGLVVFSAPCSGGDPFEEEDDFFFVVGLPARARRERGGLAADDALAAAAENARMTRWKRLRRKSSATRVPSGRQAASSTTLPNVRRTAGTTAGRSQTTAASVGSAACVDDNARGWQWRSERSRSSRA
mmetsp:Transcript_3996/g.15965  ORF Transcript_3996/g.15965 Transcript_3996/m.15965 type:complete len:205 (+) Transcript_3996:2359-2973(+)